jgi:pleckstrin homology domain-containing family G member 1/2/3
LEQKREWSQQLKRVILENYSAVIPSHARQLVMQLGQGRTEGNFILKNQAINLNNIKN